MTRAIFVILLAISFLPSRLYACENSLQHRDAVYDVVGILSFDQKLGYSLRDLERVEMTRCGQTGMGGVDNYNADDARELHFRLQLSENKILVRQLGPLLGKRVHIKGSGFEIMDALGEIIDTSKPDFLIETAPPKEAVPAASLSCKTAGDCMDVCKNAAASKECRSDGLPTCENGQCGCIMTCR